MKKTKFFSAVIAAFFAMTMVIPQYDLHAENISNSNDYLHTDGNKILDDSGNQVRLTGIAWFGLETPNSCFHGLWANRLDDILDTVADNGFNLLRVPLSVQLVNQWRKGEYPMPDSINDYISPELKGKNSLEILDTTMAYCKKIGLKVMLDMHRIESAGQTPTWYTSKYSTDDYEACWEWLANHYKDDDTVIAADIFNEPHGKPYWQGEGAKWDGSTDKNNWKYEAENVSKKILAKNPKLLIMVEGIENYPKEGHDYSDTNAKDYYGNWWGGNLRGVQNYPVDLGTHKNQVVYSPHDYGPSVSDQTWFQNGFDEDSLNKDAWGPNWFYIHQNNIAPILVGEWGGQMDGKDNEKWMRYLADFINKNGLNHTFWCLNANSGDTGGILGYDFKTIDKEKLSLVQTTLWKDQSSGKYIGLDHEVNLGKTGTHVASSSTNLKKGDVNGDGVVDIMDLNALKSYLLDDSTKIDKKSADINGDGTIDINDLMSLRNILFTN